MHKNFLLAALEQAWLGRGISAPNPSVGAVAVQNGKIIAQACHLGAGSPHAEQLVLRQIPAGLHDITLYVTLEPCNHWGRTPPCVDAIAEYGIKQVVYGYCDPNPVVAANNTPVILDRHHIEAIHYPLPEIDAFYQSYHYWTRTGRPWVTAKIAQTLDGKIAGYHGRREQLSNAQCHEFTHQKRKNCDIILTTATTINQDDPLLTVRLPGLEQNKPLAVIDSQCKLNLKAQALNAAKYCHIYHALDKAPQKTLANGQYFPIPAQNGVLQLQAVLDHIGKLGYHDVWVEAGGQLFSALHQAQLVQHTFIYLVPRWLGQNATDVFPVAASFMQNSTIRWLPMGDNMIVSLDWESVRGRDRCLPA